MIAFIDDHRGELRVEPICRHLPIAPSTYYDHLARQADPERLLDRARPDGKQHLEIQGAFEANSKSTACARSGARCAWQGSMWPDAPSSD